MAPPRDPDQTEKLLGLIYDHLGGVPDSRGNYSVECPKCGKGDKHFAYSEKGAHCFVCGYSASLWSLARDLGALEANGPPGLPRRSRPPARAPKTSPEPGWYGATDWERYSPKPSPAALAYYHSRSIDNDSIARWHLGFGYLPGIPAGCAHPRYILPVFEAGRLVALKGRRLDGTECEQMGHPKWLSAAGSRTVLFNADGLREGATVVVTAAPYNAIKAMQRYPAAVAVAPSQGEGTWRADWTERIARARPSYVVVWYDADDAGKAGAAKVERSLKASGLKVQVYPRPTGLPKGTDLSDDIDAGRFRITPTPDLTVNPKYQAPASALCRLAEMW